MSIVFHDPYSEREYMLDREITVLKSQLFTLRERTLTEAAVLCLRHNNSGEGKECHDAILALPKHDETSN